MIRRGAIAVVMCVLASSGAAWGEQQPARDQPAGRPAARSGTSTLSGRVVSTEGSPVRRAQVQLISQDAGVRKATTTDNDGSYAFAELPAGRYTIRASKGGYVSFAFGQKAMNEPVPPVILGDGESLTGLSILLPRGSAVTGRITDEFGDPILQAQVQAMRFQYLPDGERRVMPTGPMVTTDDLGQFRIYGLTPGEYVISASTRAVMMPGPPDRDQHEETDGYAPTFYPGTSNPAEAQGLSLGLGQELNVQLQLVSSRLSRIQGFIVDPQGRPVTQGTPVMLRPATNVGPAMSRPASVNGEGMFTFNGVPPGDYMIEVRPRPIPRNNQSQSSPADLEFAFVPIAIGGSDITGLRIATGTGARLSGHVVFDGAPPAPGMRVRVVPQAADPSRNVPLVARDGGNEGVVAPDGSFQLDGITGPVFLRITVDGGRADLAQRYMTKSVMVDGADVADVPFDPTRRGSVSGISVVITDKVTEVSGVVTDSRGTPVGSTSVLIVPDSLPTGISPSRFVRLLQSDATGKFSVRAMPPGRYAAMAISAMDATQQYDPAVIQRVRQLGKGFTMREGDAVALDLRVATDF
jgi:hypothetical protein